jgi:hydroxypyruvate isomerase
LGLRAPDEPLFRHLAGSGDPVRQIAFLAESGFSGVSDLGFELRSAHEQRRIADALKAHGLGFASLTHDPARWSEPTWSVGVSERGELQDALAQSLDAGALVSAQSITCVTGLDPQRDRADQLKAFAENLASFAGQAEAAGVALCVEATASTLFPGLLVDRFADACAIVRAVGHPAVRVTFDSGHIAQDGDDVLAAFDAAMDIIGAIQLCDAPGRIDPGAGTIPWPALMAKIGDSGFEGLIEAEQMPMTEDAIGEEALLSRLRAIDAM